MTDSHGPCADGQLKSVAARYGKTIRHGEVRIPCPAHWGDMVAAGRLPRPMRVGCVYRWTATDIEAAEAALRGESGDDTG